MSSLLSQIARLLTDRDLCVRCLSLAINLEEDTTQTVVEALATSVLIINAMALCGWCKTVKKTLRMPTK
jgi:hypothetical protein